MAVQPIELQSIAGFFFLTVAASWAPLGAGAMPPPTGWWGYAPWRWARASMNRTSSTSSDQCMYASSVMLWGQTSTASP